MSFGWSAGDIVAAIALSREFYDALMSSTRDFQDLKSFLRLMVANLNLVLDWSGASDNADGRHRNHTPFTDPEKHILQEVIDKLKESVTRFQKSLSNYVSLDKKPESMSTFDWIKRQGEKVRWHFLEKSEIRERKQEVMIYLEQLNPLSASQNRRSHQYLSSRLDSISSEIMANHDMAFFVLLELRQLMKRLILNIGEIPMAGSITQDTTLITGGTPTQDNQIAVLLERLQPHGLDTNFMNETDTRSVKITSMRMNSTASRMIEAWFASTGNHSSKSHPPAIWLWGVIANSLSNCVLQVRQELQQPVLYHQCHRLDENGCDIPLEKSLKALLYSSVYQLLDYIVVNNAGNDSKACLDLEVIKQLDGSLESLSAALKAVVHFFHAIRSPIVFIIENFDHLVRSADIPGNEPNSTRHISLLHDFFALINSTGTPPGMRTLLTNKGQVPILLDWLRHNQISRLDTERHVNVGQYRCAERLRAIFLGEC